VIHDCKSRYSVIKKSRYSHSQDDNMEKKVVAEESANKFAIKIRR
jgi:hypothetical protein